LGSRAGRVGRGDGEGVGDAVRQAGHHRGGGRRVTRDRGRGLGRRSDIWGDGIGGGRVARGGGGPGDGGGRGAGGGGDIAGLAGGSGEGLRREDGVYPVVGGVAGAGGKGAAGALGENAVDDPVGVAQSVQGRAVHVADSGRGTQ